MKKLSVVLLAAFLCVPVVALGAKDKKKADVEEPETKLNSGTLSGLELRGIGPAINSGRVIDFAVTPGKRHRYFVATASGNLWKTENAGTTWQPVFDGEGSYSIGTVTLDPNNHNVVWVGTGENNSQRSVSFGDGVYKSVEGGQSWKTKGLGESEHIGRIVSPSSIGRVSTPPSPSTMSTAVRRITARWAAHPELQPDVGQIRATGFSHRAVTVL